MKSKYTPNSLEETVISGGYCVGCGACASTANAKFSMQINEDGAYTPLPIASESAQELQSFDTVVCPFSQNQLSENDIFPNKLKIDSNFHPKIGYYHELYAGYVATNKFRENGSSGGVISWLAATLLENGSIDGVIHVVPNSSTTSNTLFEYSISRTINELSKGAKSHYYPVEFSNIINELRNSTGKFMFIGLPCYVKAMRLLAKNDSSINDRIAFCTALFCGHLKSTGFSESLGWQLNVHPQDLKSIDFRVKNTEKSADMYGVSVTKQSSKKETETLSSPMKNLLGADWGLGLFKLKACDYCDDITGECADISVGDAWIDPYKQDGRGTSIVVVRNKELNNLIKKSLHQCALDFDPITPEQVVTSQKSNYRHRHDGLQFRLWLADQAGKWRPNKRLKAKSTHLSETQKSIFMIRQNLSEESHRIFSEAKAANNISIFTEQLAPLIDTYRKNQLAQQTPEKRKKNDFISSLLVKKLINYCEYYKNRLLLLFFRYLRAIFQNNKSAVILPATSPGGIGDDALVSATIQHLRDQGINKICLISYPQVSPLNFTEKVDDTVDMSDYFLEFNSKDLLKFLLHTWRYRFFLQIGADVLDGYYSPQRTRQRLQIANYASATGMDTTIIGFSFNENPHKKALKSFQHLNEKVRICFRDAISKERFAKQFPNKKTYQTADVAFLLKPTVSDTCSFHQNLAFLKTQGTMIIGINVIKTSKFHGAKQHEDDIYINAFKQLVIRLTDEFKDIVFAFIPHDYRPGICDTIPLAKLYRSLPESVRSKILIPDKYLTAAEIKHACGYLDFTISSRMHLAIACLGQGVPAACISYQGKFEGLYQLFGTPQLLLDKQELLSNFEQSYSQILSLINQRKELAQKIKEKLPSVTELSEFNFSAITNTLNN